MDNLSLNIQLLAVFMNESITNIPIIPGHLPKKVEEALDGIRSIRQALVPVVTGNTGWHPNTAARLKGNLREIRTSLESQKSSQAEEVRKAIDGLFADIEKLSKKYESVQTHQAQVKTTHRKTEIQSNNSTPSSPGMTLTPEKEMAIEELLKKINDINHDFQQINNEARLRIEQEKLTPLEKRILAACEDFRLIFGAYPHKLKTSSRWINKISNAILSLANACLAAREGFIECVLARQEEKLVRVESESSNDNQPILMRYSKEDGLQQMA